MRVALSEVLGALSYALDITEGEPPGHALRTTAIGMRLARPARILAVADVFEALTADRLYREAMAREQALAIVREQRGTGLCPAAVDALETAATGGAAWVADVARLGSDGDARVSPPVRRPA